MAKYTFPLAMLVGSALVCTANAQKYSFSVLVDGLQPTTIRRAYAINDAGTVLLQPYSAYNTSTNCLLITGSKITKTEQYPGTDQYFSLSNNGYITGIGINGVYYLDPAYNLNQITLATGDTGYPTGINRFQFVVGMATSPVSGFYAWTSSKGGPVKKFSYPGSTESTLTGVNDSGDMVGTYFTGNLHKQFYAFVTSKGKGTEIIVPGCIDPTPSAISSTGIIAGTAISQPSNRHLGFVRSKAGVVEVIDYSKYVPASITAPDGSKANLIQYGTDVYGVNAAGTIVGTFTGTYQNKAGTWSETQSIPFVGTVK